MLYQPSHFRVEERAHALAVMRAHPFATLVSMRAGEPVFTHLPLHVRETGDALHLLGHVARGNPQADDFAGGTVTAIFQAGDAYVSPGWYEAKEAVPTWNYIVAHASGRVRRVDDSAGKETILKALIDAHDPPYHAVWNDELSEDYRERMKRGIVGLIVDVERIDAKFKLSQNRSAQDKANVLAAMDRGDAGARELAAWMRRLGIGVGP
jgi:transcriptional regulator